MNVLKSPWSFSWWWPILSPSDELVLIYIQNRNHSLRLFESTVWTLSDLLCDIAAQTASWLDPCVSDLWPPAEVEHFSPGRVSEKVLFHLLRHPSVNQEVHFDSNNRLSAGHYLYTRNHPVDYFILLLQVRARRLDTGRTSSLLLSNVRRMFKDIMKNKSPREKM